MGLNCLSDEVELPYGAVTTYQSTIIGLEPRGDVHVAKIQVVTLPFFAETASLFMDAFNHRVQLHVNTHGVFGQLQTHVIHEGKESRIVRDSTDADDLKLHAAEASYSLPDETVGKFDIADMIRAIASIGDQFIQAQSKIFYDEMNRITEKTGNVVDARSKPLSFDLLMELQEKMPIEFDAAGSITGLSMIVGPEMEPRIKQMQKEFEASPDLQQRYQDMLRRKYEEYRNREMDRNLAG